MSITGINYYHLIKNMDFLNEYSGLIGLLAVISPFIVYWIERREKRKDWLDEYNSLLGYGRNGNNGNPDVHARLKFLKKKLNK